MPDTGAPWNIPYVASTDLVSDWPADSLALANAIDAGLDAAGGLVDVKSALFTGTMTETNVAGGANFAVTDLSITHSVADASNKLIISAYLGAAANAYGRGNVGLAIHDGTSLINIGDADGNRSRITAGGEVGNITVFTVTMPSVTFVHTPGAGSKTYTVRAINLQTGTQTIYINRNQDNTDDAQRVRATSGLVIQEVKV